MYKIYRNICLQCTMCVNICRSVKYFNTIYQVICMDSGI